MDTFLGTFDQSKDRIVFLNLELFPVMAPNVILSDLKPMDCQIYLKTLTRKQNCLVAEKKMCLGLAMFTKLSSLLL